MPRKKKEEVPAPFAKNIRLPYYEKPDFNWTPHKPWYGSFVWVDGSWYRSVREEVYIDGYSIEEAIERLRVAAEDLVDARIDVPWGDESTNIYVEGKLPITGEELEHINEALVRLEAHTNAQNKAQEEADLARFREKYPHLVKDPD